MAADIGPKIGIDGEAQFRKQLGDINQALKAMGAEQKAVASAFRDEADAEKKMAAQKDVLNRQIEAQKEKLAMLEKGLRDSAKMYGEADTRTQKWQQAVHEATASLNDMVGQMEGMDGTIEDTADALGDAEEATSGWADVMKGQLLADAVKTGLTKVYDMVKDIAGAMWDASKAGAAYADDVLTMSTVTGLSTDQLQEYKYMADLIDVSVDTISGSMKKLISSMTSAQGGNKEMAASFEELGVSVTDETGKLRDNQDVFNDVISALGKIDNETERDAKAMKIFGKSAQDLNPLIAAGADKLQALAKEANETGYVLNGASLDALGKQQDAMDKLGKKTEALKNRFAVGLAPSVEKAADKLSDMMDSPAVRIGIDNLSRSVGGMVEGFADLAANVIPGLMKAISSDAAVRILSDETLELMLRTQDAAAMRDRLAATYNDNAGAILSEKERLEDLWKELQNITSESGEVMDADKDRAQFILNELNDALGTEYEMNGNIIGQYQDMQKEVDNLIQLQTAKGLASAFQEKYQAAYQNRDKALADAAGYLSEIAAAEERVAAAQKAVDEADAAWTKLYNGRQVTAYGVYTERQKNTAVDKELRDQIAALDALKAAYADASKTAAGYYGDIQRYEEAQAAILQGNAEKAIQLLSDETGASLEYYKRKKELNEQERKDLQDKLESMKESAKQYMIFMKEGQKGFTKEGLAELEGFIEDARKILAGEYIGESFLDGLTRGLKNRDKLKEVEKAAYNAAYVVRQRAQNTLEIKSPSRVAAWIGEMWDEGLIRGLEAKEDELAKAATGLADIITDSSNPGAFAYGNDLTAAGYGAAYGETNSYTTNLGGITVRVDGADGVNEDILAQRIAVRLTDELNRARRGRA